MLNFLAFIIIFFQLLFFFFFLTLQFIPLTYLQLFSILIKCTSAYFSYLFFRTCNVSYLALFVILFDWYISRVRCNLFTTSQPTILWQDNMVLCHMTNISAEKQSNALFYFFFLLRIFLNIVNQFCISQWSVRRKVFDKLQWLFQLGLSVIFAMYLASILILLLSYFTDLPVRNSEIFHISCWHITTIIF